MVRIGIFMIIGALAVPVSAQEILTPPDAAQTYNIPSVPMELVRRADAYTNYRTAAFGQWHPERLEMLILTRFADTYQVHEVTRPGARREQLTFYPEPVLGVSAYDVHGAQPFFTFVSDRGGDEFYQVYRFDRATGAQTLLTDGEKRNGGGVYSKETGRLAYRRVDADADGAFTQIRVVDPRDPPSDRLVATFRGGGWFPTDWSPNGKRVLLQEYVSINDSRVWELKARTGKVKRLFPGTPGGVYAGAPKYAPDGESVYLLTDADSEFRRLVRIGPDSGDRTVISAEIDWDVDAYDVSPDGAHIAFVTNEAGRSRLNLIGTATGARRHVPAIPNGVIGALQFHDDSRHLALTVTTASIPGDVFVVDVTDTTLARWTYSEAGIDTSGFAEAELIEWESFDGMAITGFLYRPPERFTGKRPVIMIIHGGPEGQSRPHYLGRWNYFLNELGAALVFPNVRGSSGYGKTFLKLDNGTLREGTYRDIGALLDWIRQQPGLDAERIMVYGGSYGGHMTLATAVHYSDRIACAVNLFGISNLRTFLENTEGYRRDLRRVEYGDERDPEIRAWMEATAPLNNVDRIRAPLFIQQGANDPRVPKSESDQIFEQLTAAGTPAWYLVFDDEGHGWRRKPNADYAFYTTIQFAEKYLLEPPTNR